MWREFHTEEYSVECRKFVSWVPGYDAANLQFIGFGPNSDDYTWTRKFFERLAAKGGFGLHPGLVAAPLLRGDLGRGHVQGWGGVQRRGRQLHGSIGTKFCAKESVWRT